MSRLVAAFAALAMLARVVAVNVASCAELATMDTTTLASLTELTISTVDFECEEYTRVPIRSDMVLKSSVGKVTFTNFALKIIGSIVVEMDVEFTGVKSVEKNGGALKLDLGATAMFMGTADFRNNSIVSTYEDAEVVGENFVEIGRKGPAIHNKGQLVFEKDASFIGNLNEGVEKGSGPGGAVSVHGKGSIHFKGKLVMKHNEADDYFGGAEGGALYNRGDVIVDGEAEFLDNQAGSGGAIYQEKWATLVFNSFVSFQSNKCVDTYGGTVANIGGDLTTKAGSSFIDGFAENTGDGGYGGAIYNYGGGVVTLEGATLFRENYGFYGGAIFNAVQPSRAFEEDDFDESRYTVPAITYPADTVFEDNYGEYCNDVAYDFDSETCGL